ncbi:MAG: TipAS antibiotic-recognition domain-containing protein [Pseudomonadota bacterium]
MKLKVGELAKRAGLTVRALHHYDHIGLLSASARSDAGYRLYDRSDIARLHQIQALRRFGVALSDIGAFLASPGARLPAIVDQQICALTRQIEQASVLRTQLTRLKGQLDAGEEPELADWLTTLEQMTMYDKYFTQEQRERLPFFSAPNASTEEWKALVERCHALMAANTPPSDPHAQELACRWMRMLARDTGGDAAMVVQLNAMNASEPSARERNRITPELSAYVQQALTSYRLGLFESYLDPDEFAFLKANYGKRSSEWPPLIARVQKEMSAGTAATDPAATQLAREWMALFASYAGTDPATHLKIRKAHATEPGLLEGSFIGEEMLAFVREAIAAAMRG